MSRQPPELKVIIVERKEGYDRKRLSVALSLLISEKDIVDYFSRATGSSDPLDKHVHVTKSLSQRGS